MHINDIEGETYPLVNIVTPARLANNNTDYMLVASRTKVEGGEGGGGLVSKPNTFCKISIVHSG